MRLINATLQADADIIKEEILNSASDWFWPVDKKHKVFEQAHMKFLNRNLNYFSFSEVKGE